MGAVADRDVWFCDLDGTLVDSSPVHQAAFRSAFAELAPAAAAGFRYRAVAGLSTTTVVRSRVDDDELAARVVRRKQELYRDLVDLGRVPVYRGAHRLLAQLAQSGRRVYVVTNGSRASACRVLVTCRLDEYVHGVLAAEDLPAPKPSPAAYREACRRWQADPERTVVLEDSVHGVQSALAAGLLTVQVHTSDPAPGALAVPDLDALASILIGAGV